MVRNLCVLVLLCGSPALAQEYKNATHLGGSTSFSRPLVTDADVIKLSNQAVDIRTVLTDSGIPEANAGVYAQLSSHGPVVKIADCADATPADGQLVACAVQPGTTLEWMAYRPHGKVSRLEHIRWAGRKPFDAYLFRVSTQRKVYTFVVPKICGNISLLKVDVVPEPKREVVVVARVEPPPAVVEASKPEPVVIVESIPPPVVIVAEKPARFFVDVLGGKDRRTRPVDSRTTIGESRATANAGKDQFAQCSPLFGVKLGYAYPFKDTWEVAGTGGVAFSLVNDQHKVQEHEVFADVEINKYLGRSFVGTGLSFWDLTHRDTFTPAVAARFGLPLGSHPRYPLYFIGEGRVFLKSLDNVANNYQVWAGLRAHI